MKEVKLVSVNETQQMYLIECNNIVIGTLHLSGDKYYVDSMLPNFKGRSNCKSPEEGVNMMAVKLREFINQVNAVDVNIVGGYDLNEYSKFNPGTDWLAKKYILDSNINIELSYMSNMIGQLYDGSLDEIYEILKHDNLFVAMLPIYKYKGRTISMGSNYLDVDQIKKHLDDQEIVFIYTIQDKFYEKGDKLKFRTKWIKNEEIVKDNEGE